MSNKYKKHVFKNQPAAKEQDKVVLIASLVSILITSTKSMHTGNQSATPRKMKLAALRPQGDGANVGCLDSVL